MPTVLGRLERPPGRGRAAAVAGGVDTAWPRSSSGCRRWCRPTDSATGSTSRKAGSKCRRNRRRRLPEIDRVETVATDNDTALASDIEDLTATVGANTAAITVNATAIAARRFAATRYSVTLDVSNYATEVRTDQRRSGVSNTTFTTDNIPDRSTGGCRRRTGRCTIFTVLNVGGSAKGRGARRYLCRRHHRGRGAGRENRSRRRRSRPTASPPTGW